MGFPEKDPKDASKAKSDGPKLDAILPDDAPPTAAELVDDISTYQQRMEKEWETAKVAYEQKINRIMNEFVAEGLNKQDDPRPASGAEAPRATPRGAGGARLQDLIHQLEKELHDVPRSPQFEPQFFASSDPNPMQLGWHNTSAGLRQRIQRGAIALALVALVATAVWVAKWRIIQTPLPYKHTLGPIVANGKIYIVDWFRKILFVHKNNTNLTITSVEAMPNDLATGFAMSEKTLWTIDSLDTKILLHTVTTDHQVTSSISAPDTRPVGLYFDGVDLWSADQEAYKLYRHRGNDIEEIRDSFPLPDITITSFLLNKTQLWILDGKSRLITVYRLQKPLLKLAAYDLDALLKQATPTGMTFDGNTVLITTENPPTLLRIPQFRLRHSRLKTSV